MPDGVTALRASAGGFYRAFLASNRFDIKDGHRLVDPKGQDLKDDAEAIDKAKTMAIGVSLDKPEVDPTRRIVVMDDDRRESFSEPVYSKPVAR